MPATTPRVHTPDSSHLLDHSGDGPDTPIEAFLSGALLLAVRLWCLPALLILWGLTWTAIITIRGTALLIQTGRLLASRITASELVHFPSSPHGR